MPVAGVSSALLGEIPAAADDRPGESLVFDFFSLDAALRLDVGVDLEASLGSGLAGFFGDVMGDFRVRFVSICKLFTDQGMIPLD
jgi:hypothetical protein